MHETHNLVRPGNKIVRAYFRVSVQMNDSLRLVGAHVKMDVKLPCTLASCSQDIKQIFKEVITAIVDVEPEVVSMDFSEDQTSTRIEVRVRVPLEKVQKGGA